MSPLLFGAIAGVSFGLLAVGSMVPLEFADKTAAMLAAFFSRFAIGFVIPNLQLPGPGLATGAAIGVLLSLPDAIVTKAYAPILGIGLVGGGLIGWLAQRIAG